MLVKMQELFKAELFADFEKGTLDTTLAIKELVRTGMSQLEAQTALLGDSYNNLIVLLGGSIPVIDRAGEAFNDIYDALDELDCTIESLPNSLKRSKRELYEVSYELRYLVNMTQSFVSLRQDWDDFGKAFTDLGAALKAGDLDVAVRSLNTMQMYALEAASAVQQLADAIRYLGNSQNSSTDIAPTTGVPLIKKLGVL